LFVRVLLHLLTKSTRRQQRCREADAAALESVPQVTKSASFSWHGSCSYKANPAQQPTDKGEMKMNKLMIAAASLMIAASAQASQPEFNLVEVEMTPIAEAQKPLLLASDRFANYELENSASSGQ
jgi:hypothetical protein